MNDTEILKKITRWLEDEVEDGQQFVGAKENNEEEICSDGSDDIYIGRHECADSLLQQIEKWKGVKQ